MRTYTTRARSNIHFFNVNFYDSKVTTFNLVDEYNKRSPQYILKNNQIILGIPAFEQSIFSISENAPNPFSVGTNFSLNLSNDARVQISISDIQGRVIGVPENDRKIPGTYD